MTDDRELLTEAENVLHSLSMRLLGISPRLQEPYTDMPGTSPWSMTFGPLARRAHDVALAIRKHLGLPRTPAIRALGTLPLKRNDALAGAVADLHMAGIKTGEQYEQLVSEVIAGITDAWDGP